jgi:catalase (peroxidase I)
MNLIVELTLLYENPQHNQVYAEKYAEDQDAFFRDYAEAHAKLSELGAKFQPPQVSVNISVLSFPSSTLWFSLKWQFNWLWVGN